MEKKQVELLFQDKTAFKELTLNRGSKLVKPAKSDCDSPLVGLHEITHVWLQHKRNRKETEEQSYD